jgi:hypothetical protein
MSKDYWYGHSETDLARHSDRKEVLRPIGLFIHDGRSLSRTGRVAVNIPTFTMAVPTTTAASSHPSSPVKGSITQSLGPPKMQDYKDRYYSRFFTPQSEHLINYRESLRRAQVSAYKRIYHADLSYHSPSSLHRVEKTDLRRLFVPKTKHLKSLETTLK